MKTKKELLKLPARGHSAEEIDTLYRYILVVPSGTKHESGYMHMAVIGVTETGKEVCGFPDDICWILPDSYAKGFPMAHLRTDCYYPQGILKFWGRGSFKVGFPTSSIEITFIPNT